MHAETNALELFKLLSCPGDDVKLKEERVQFQVLENIFIIGTNCFIKTIFRRFPLLINRSSRIFIESFP